MAFPVRVISLLCLLTSAMVVSGAPPSPERPKQHITERGVLQKRDWPIKSGYVAFGDSYGAGMGTGVTSTDACRVGSNNFGSLLNQWTNNQNVDYQQKVCSGDTTVGLQRQINEWQNPSKADVATVSMGGNDLGFSNLVWYCVITPNAIDQPGRTAKKCEEAKTSAKNLMTDTSDNGLRAKLKTTYLNILKKSGRSDFHLYVTGYPSFFNFDTDYCNWSTFYYWNPHHNFLWDPRYVYLTKKLREELDGLVDQLSTTISGAVDDANHEHGGDAQVHFVDVNGRWPTHRWCEDGAQDPDESRADTWFFLSAWKDVPIDAAAAIGVTEAIEAIIEGEEVNAIIKSGSIQLPNADTCLSDLGTDPDLAALFMCRLAMDIRDDPNGFIAQDIAATNADIANSIVNSTHIPWYTPTRQVKTFHPRSPGMVAYRDAIIDAINRVSGTGICKLQVEEIWTCEDQAFNLYANIKITGRDGSTLYSTPGSTSSPGEPINDATPAHIRTNGMSETLVVTAEHVNDYIQFNYGAQAWTSGTTVGPATCALSGDDWNHDGPQGCPTTALTRTFNCQYQC